jgi:hypothetical protein
MNKHVKNVVGGLASAMARAHAPYWLKLFPAQKHSHIAL